MTAAARLCVLSLAPLDRDARVLRQIHLGRRLGYRVTAVAWSAPPQPAPDVTAIAVPRQQFGRTGRALQGLLVAAGRARPELWKHWYWRKPDHRAALEAVRASRPDLLHANEAIALPLAVRAATDTGARLLFDAHELSLDQRKGPRIEQHLAAPLYQWILRTYAPRCHAMITVSPRIAGIYAAALGVPCGVVRNAPAYRAGSFRPTDPDCIRLVHHGLAIRGRRLEDMLAVLGRLDDRFRLRLMLVPSSPGYIEELQASAERTAPGRVEFRPPVEPDQITEAIGDCDVGLAVIPPIDESYRLALPNKFFDFLMAGLCVVVGPSPEMVDVCSQYGCGLVADGHSVTETTSLLASVRTEVIDDCKRGALRAAKELNAENEMDTLARLYARLLAGGDPWAQSR